MNGSLFCFSPVKLLAGLFAQWNHLATFRARQTGESKYPDQTTGKRWLTIIASEKQRSRHFCNQHWVSQNIALLFIFFTCISLARFSKWVAGCINFYSSASAKQTVMASTHRGLDTVWVAVTSPKRQCSLLADFENEWQCNKKHHNRVDDRNIAVSAEGRRH